MFSQRSFELKEERGQLMGFSDREYLLMVLVTGKNHCTYPLKNDTILLPKGCAPSFAFAKNCHTNWKEKLGLLMRKGERKEDAAHAWQ